MRRILFVKKSGRMSGGHIKFHDYFAHCIRHPGLEPYIYLAYERTSDAGAIWDADRERIVPTLDLEPYDAVFIDGRDWELLPPSVENNKNIIHLIQDFRHGDRSDPRFSYLSRRALRICISPELAEAVRPHACGPVAVIPNGVDTTTFSPAAKEPSSVLVWARKDRELGKSLRAVLAERGVSVRLLTRPVERREFAKLLAVSDVFVGITKEREGFFLPALEAMSSGCAVVCADAVGNRGYCIDRETCRTASFGDLDDHVRLVQELLADRQQLDALRARGLATARAYTLEREQALFHQVVEEHILETNALAEAG